jgi:hypothetical protein
MVEGIEQLIAAGHIGQAWDTLDSEPARQVLRSHNRLYLLRASIARAGEMRITGHLVDQPLLDVVIVKLLMEALPKKEQPQGLNRMNPALKAKATARIRAEPDRWTVDALMAEYTISRGLAADWLREGRAKPS